MGKNVELKELVLRLQKGDETALSTIYDLYNEALYGLILRIVRDESIASDVLQESFVKIWKKANTYAPGKGTFFTWMLNICRNGSIDELRKLERTRNGKNRIDDAGVYKTNALETSVDTIGLKDIVDKLPEKQRLIVEYTYFKGYTQQEISDELDIPLGTVKTWARKALISLADSFVLIIIIWTLKSI